MDKYVNGGKIIEVMAGIGRNVPMFKQFRVKDIEILDISDQMIKIAKEKHKEITTYT